MKAEEYLKLKNGLEGVVKRLNKDKSILDRILGVEYVADIGGIYSVGLVRQSRNFGENPHVDLGHRYNTHIAEICDAWISHERSSAEDSEKLVCALHPNYKKEAAVVEKFLHEFSHSTGARYEFFYGAFIHGNQKPIAPGILLNAA